MKIYLCLSVRSSQCVSHCLWIFISWGYIEHAKECDFLRIDSNFSKVQIKKKLQSKICLHIMTYVPIFRIVWKSTTGYKSLYLWIFIATLNLSMMG